MNKILLLALLFSYSLCLDGQEEWNLERCVLHAVENSIELYRSGISVDEAKTLTRESREARLPSLNANTTVQWNFGRTIDPTTNDFVTSTFFSNGYGLNSNITLFNAGRQKNVIRQNESNERAANEDMQSMKTLIVANVIAAYFEILFAEDNYKNVEVQLKTIQDQMDQMQKMVDVGTRAQFELIDLDAQKASIEQQLTAGQNRIDLAYLNLKGQLNLPADFDMMVADPPADQETYTNVDIATLDEVFERALAFQPESKALEHRIASAELGIELAEAALYPSVFAGVSAFTNFSNQGKDVDGFTTDQINTNVLIDGQPSVVTTDIVSPILVNSPYFNQIDNNFSYGFGFQVNIPIYNNYTARGSIQRAKLNAERLKLDRDINRISLRNNVGQYITDARASKRTLEASERTLEAREVAFENAQKRFDLGAINSYDYISIQDQLNTAKTDYIIAKYDYLLKVKILDFLSRLSSKSELKTNGKKEKKQTETMAFVGANYFGACHSGSYLLSQSITTERRRS